MEEAVEVGVKVSVPVADEVGLEVGLEMVVWVLVAETVELGVEVWVLEGEKVGVKVLDMAVAVSVGFCPPPLLVGVVGVFLPGQPMIRNENPTIRK